MTLLIGLNIIIPVTVSHASALDTVINTLSASTAPTVSSDSGGGFLNSIFSLLFDKILGPILNIFSGKSNNQTNPAGKITPLPSSDGVLHGKTIVIDPGHGGSNPGAIKFGFRESDNNLAVGLRVRDKLVQAGAKVILTRDSDRTVAPEGNTLGKELQARLDIAAANNADIFVSIHTNENDNSSITGTTTYYATGKSSELASVIQNSVVNQTGFNNRGIMSANFYVLRNATMPSALVEMGFISNQEEATRLNSDAYREKIAQGIVKGITAYFNNN